MLINIEVATSSAHQKLSTNLLLALATVGASAIVWVVSAVRLQKVLEPPQAFPSLPRPSPIEGLGTTDPSDGADRPPTAILGALSGQASSLGLNWQSSTLTLPGQALGASSGLEAWQASVKLSGTYPALKRWMRETTTRYPHIVWRSAQWTPAVASAGAPGSVFSPAANLLELEVQLSWLKRAPDAASSAGSSSH